MTSPIHDFLSVADLRYELISHLPLKDKLSYAIATKCISVNELKEMEKDIYSLREGLNMLENELDKQNSIIAALRAAQPPRPFILSMRFSYKTILIHIGLICAVYAYKRWRR